MERRAQNGDDNGPERTLERHGHNDFSSLTNGSNEEEKPMTSEFVPSVQDDGRFGRWGNMQAWGKEADAIIEKPLPSSAAESLPISEHWVVPIREHCVVEVSIPGREDGYYGDAMEAGLALLAEIGVHAEEAHIEDDCFVIELKPRKSLDAAFLAEQIRKWLVANGYRVTLGGDRTCWSSPDGPAFLQLITNFGYVPTAGDWSLSLLRIPEEAGRNLAAHLGITPQIVDLSGAMATRKHFEFQIGDFGDAKAKTMQALSWLKERDFEIDTSWGDPELSLDSLSEDAVRSLNWTGLYLCHWSSQSTNISVELRDEKAITLPEWLSRVLRIVSRADGSAEEVPIVLCRCEVRALLDLAAELSSDCDAIRDDFLYWSPTPKIYRQYKQDELKALTIIHQIIDKLHAALHGEQTTAPSRE